MPIPKCERNERLKLTRQRLTVYASRLVNLTAKPRFLDDKENKVKKTIEGLEKPYLSDNNQRENR
ncbi:hypothetical protein ACTXT7_014304, partial [Hymenolepis weldensis]